MQETDYVHLPGTGKTGLQELLSRKHSHSSVMDNGAEAAQRGWEAKGKESAAR